MFSAFLWNIYVAEDEVIDIDESFQVNFLLPKSENVINYLKRLKMKNVLDLRLA